MSFNAAELDTFLNIFHESSPKIRAFEGCRYLSLHRDHHHHAVYFTVSRWDSQEHLDNYRHSDLFRSTWSKTRVLFAEKPSAYSLDQVVELS